MKREQLAAGGAIGASILIAACCFAPAMFLLFGVSVGALGMLTALEPYRPFFIAAGGLALSYAGYRAFRTAPEGDAGCEGDACARDGPSRRTTRRLLIGALVLYTVTIAYP